MFAKRKPRPFPPPFTSPPSISFSDALSTHHKSRDRRAVVHGDLIRGQTNGDDAVYASERFICANDGVGAWAARPRGHAGLWSRLMLHFWAVAVDEASSSATRDTTNDPQPVNTLQIAYERTLEATTEHNWQGTTTVCGAQLHYGLREQPGGEEVVPILYVTNLGDSQVMVLRPRDQEVIFKTKEQWHWFDCPRQLGTNSPDRPVQDAVADKIELAIGDVVLAMTDGVIDNLWEHEITGTVFNSLRRWEEESKSGGAANATGDRGGGMEIVARDLVAAAKQVATDPFAESPYMEHAIEEGLASEGGKLDDISVVAALCIEG